VFTFDFGLFRAIKKKYVTPSQYGGIIMEFCVARQPSHSATMEVAMQGKTKDVWMQYCEQAAVEQDPEKLLELVKEINRMLEKKENRLLRSRDQDKF
jgi:hypothetical protein